MILREAGQYIQEKLDQKKLDPTHIQRYKKWLQWEKEVAYELSLLQWEFRDLYVIHDFQTNEIGNIDHIIICKKGIFAIETKNCDYINQQYCNKFHRQIKNNAQYLKSKLKKSGINWVRPIIVGINNSSFRYLLDSSDKKTEVIHINDFSKIIKESNNIVKDPKEIYKILTGKQQKTEA